MSRYTSVNFDANETITLADIKTTNNDGSVSGMVQVTGTFDGGSLAFKMSLDGGATTPNDWLDLSGTAYVLTDVQTFPFTLNFNDDTGVGVQLSATMSGVGTTSVDVLILTDQ